MRSWEMVGRRRKSPKVKSPTVKKSPPKLKNPILCRDLIGLNSRCFNNCGKPSSTFQLFRTFCIRPFHVRTFFRCSNSRLCLDSTSARKWKFRALDGPESEVEQARFSSPSRAWACEGWAWMSLSLTKLAIEPALSSGLFRLYYFSYIFW